MTVQLFEGRAGSGKTTRLFGAVADHVLIRALEPDQRVLALTKMHGSRRRMQGKLIEVLGTGTTSDCITLNSFTHGLVHRWRALAQTLVSPLPGETEFTAVAAIAARLLELDNVLSWVRARYPLLVVDELQDLRGPELRVVTTLSRGLDVLCAADEFQDLDPIGVCEAVDWANGVGDVVRLDQIHRTSVSGLLQAAHALRTAQPLMRSGHGIEVVGVPTPHLAAWKVGARLARSRGSVAVISTSGPSAPFVKQLLERLAAKPFGWRKDGSATFGPFDVPWESDHRSEVARAVAQLGLEDEDRVLSADDIRALGAELPGGLLDWVAARGRIAGETSFAAARVRAELERAHALQRAHVPIRPRRHVALTVHAAKNREFEHVVVLWPFQVAGDHDKRRRLLYNALTRARKDCLVIVQDPNVSASRLDAPPFS